MDQFDPNFPGLLEGDITNVTVIDPVFQGNRVINPTQPFDVQVDWEIRGTHVPIYLGGAVQNWTVSVYGDTVGPGIDLVLANVLKNKNDSVPCAGVSCTKYTVTVTVPAGTLQEHDVSHSGIYKIAAAVFLNGMTPGNDLIGFREGPVIQAEAP